MFTEKLQQTRREVNTEDEEFRQQEQASACIGKYGCVFFFTSIRNLNMRHTQ